MCLLKSLFKKDIIHIFNNELEAKYKVTVKSRAVDQSTIQFELFWPKVTENKPKFPFHKQSKNP